MRQDVPRKRPPVGGHPLHRHHEWLENYELELPLADAAEKVKYIAEVLIENEAVVVGKHTVAPADPCEFILRYERMPRGELSLKIELKWDSEQSADAQAEPSELVLGRPGEDA